MWHVGNIYKRECDMKTAHLKSSHGSCSIVWSSNKAKGSWWRYCRPTRAHSGTALVDRSKHCFLMIKKKVTATTKNKNNNNKTKKMSIYRIFFFKKQKGQHRICLVVMIISSFEMCLYVLYLHIWDVLIYRLNILSANIDPRWQILSNRFYLD